jgi:hypothetical protein
LPLRQFGSKKGGISLEKTFSLFFDNRLTFAPHVVG